MNKFDLDPRFMNSVFFFIMDMHLIHITLIAVVLITTGRDL